MYVCMYVCVCVLAVLYQTLRPHVSSIVDKLLGMLGNFSLTDIVDTLEALVRMRMHADRFISRCGDVCACACVYVRVCACVRVCMCVLGM